MNKEQNNKEQHQNKGLSSKNQAKSLNTSKSTTISSSNQQNTKGLQAKKSENFSEWYTQVIQKADLADYSVVSGCIVYKPNSYAIWEKIRDVTDKKFKAIGIQNAYFPLFIPESLLKKEATHLQGFSPEVAWVTHGGDTLLGEKLAIRPTSETIMYDSYSKWIRSHQDLPLRYNQWNNVVRWEFKHPVPFLRGREFLWNEGHTCFATKAEAESEGPQIIGIYDDVCRDYLALPSLIGRKSETEKFAGAEYTVSMEFVVPNGKAIQGPDFHHDGQIFSKAFDITFMDQTGQKQYVWQNTWAITTRMIGVMVAIHGDDKGLIIPPKVAAIPVVIIPIIFDDSKAQVLKAALEIKTKLEEKGFAVKIDDREGYTPGWKYNEWEVKGIPLRLEIGPKDLEKKQVLTVRRDTGEKQALPINGIDEEVKLILDQIQENLLHKAEELLESSITQASSVKEAEKALENKKIVFGAWCATAGCEEELKTKYGIKTLNSPLTSRP